MIYSKSEISLPTVLEETTSSSGEVFQTSIADAIADNPTTKLYQYAQMNMMDSEAEEQGQKFLSRDDALVRAKSRGVVIQNLPDSISENAYNLLEERQYQKKVRSSVIEGGSGASMFAGNLVGSFLDPLNIATSFVPVFGQAKVAAMLGRSTSFAGRAAVRAGVGAAEGAVGAAIIEPLNYGLSQELGDDYTTYNSLMNIGVGTVMGSALHVTGGAIKDKISPDAPKLPQTPAQKIIKQFDSMTPEQRELHLKTAVSQLVEGRPVDVELVGQKIQSDVGAQLDELELEMKVANESGDTEVLEVLTKQYENLSKVMDEEISIKNNDFEVINRESLGDAPSLKDVEVRVGKALDGNTEVRVKVDGELKVVSKIEGDTLTTKTGEEVSLKKVIDEEGIEIKSASNAEANIGGVKRKGPSEVDVRNAASKAATSPDSIHVDKELTSSHDEVRTKLDSEIRFEKAEELAQAEIDNLTELASRKEIDIEKITKDADELISGVKEYTNVLKTLAKCATGGL